MAFIRKIQTKMVSASGATNLRSPWNTSRTWVSMNSTVISRNACSLPGTPEVARRPMNQNRPRPSTPMATAISRLSTFNVQNDPSPMDTVQCLRWWLTYSLGLSPAT